MAKSRLSSGLRTTKGGDLIVPRMGVSGIEETQRLLKQIPINVRDKLLAKALRAGGEELRKEEVTNVTVSKRQTIEKRIYWGRQRSGKPKKTRMVLQRGGILKKALEATGAIMTKKGADKHPIVWVGATHGKRAKPYDAWYAHFYEFGTSRYKPEHRRGFGYVLKAYRSSYSKSVRKIYEVVFKEWNKIIKNG